MNYNKEIVKFIDKTKSREDLEFIRELLTQLKEQENKKVFNNYNNQFDNSSSDNVSFVSNGGSRESSPKVLAKTTSHYKGSRDDNIASSGGFISALLLSYFVVMFSILFMMIGYIFVR